MNFLRIVCMALALGASGPAFAQGAGFSFGLIQQDLNAPVEATADQLSVDQASGTSVFSGNVVVGQGAMRLTAAEVLVVYRSDDTGIARLEARGDVTLVSGPDAAEAEQADYNIDEGTIEMRGNVLLAQGQNVLTAERMFVNLRTGEARMSGRIKTILQTEGN